MRCARGQSFCCRWLRLQLQLQLWLWHCWSFEHSCNPVRCVCVSVPSLLFPPPSLSESPLSVCVRRVGASPCILFSFIIYLLLNFSTTLVALGSLVGAS